MTGYRVMYNNVSDKAVGCHASSRPSIPAPERVTDVTAIPGRDSSLYDTDNLYSDIVIPVTFSFSDPDPAKWGTIYRRVKNWILSESKGELRFSDDDSVHYKVLSTRITTTERVARTIGTVTAEFVCEGYAYLNSGDAYVELAATIINEHMTCHPIYRITGTGQCVLTVNGHEFSLAVSGGTVIDTDLFVSYSITDGSLVNTTVTGDYQDLWLLPGQNTMAITAGFSCDFMPQWRCL